MTRVAFAATVLLATLGVARLGFARNDELISEAQGTIAKFRRTDPGIDEFFRRSAAYVVFPGIGKGGYIVGGAHGTGVLFENGVPSGKVTMNQVSVGPQVGGEEFAEVIFLETPHVLSDFRQGKVKFSAQASAVALDQGAAAVARYRNGVAIFTKMKGGLMAEASVGGQQFKYEPFAR
ncbi:MAG TPA: lipid-binding SYLF domain-containing protein [Polyangia bacterium]|jgi:lipid-binding SYLF domain-containing protein|nr:lipid-binding SYLF domain-containing protein [Polyangia bacterium]